MKTLMIFKVFLFCIVLKCSFTIVPITGSRLEDNICNICSCSTNGGFQVVNCSSSYSVPAMIPEGTTYLDLSNNNISTLSDADLDRFKDVKVLNLRRNPLVCDCRLALSIKRLTSSSDVRVIGYCYFPESSVAMEIDKADPRTICPNSTKPAIKRHRVRRSVAVVNCTIGSPTCAFILCHNNKYWLPITTDWGCCYGDIHDLTSSYCIGNGVGITKCSNNDFRCNNQHCVPQEWTCSGSNDCQDGSDEVNCGKCRNPATFQCKNRKRCVDKHRVCDTYNDCGDGSDETYCRKSYLIGWCGVEFFRCANEKCVFKGKVCDGNDDCGDNSDEHGCIIHNSATRCESGWSFYKNKCYKRFKSSLTWNDALQSCISNNASLIKMTSSNEKVFLRSLVPGKTATTYWIGLRNYSNEFRWPDGTLLNGYIAFDQTNSTSFTGQCIVLENVGMKWRLHDCSAKNPFLCSKDATCRLPCLNGGSCSLSGCLCTSGWAGEYCSYKRPVINMPLFQTIRVQFNSNLSFSCQSTGIPRPHIDWLINKQTVSSQQTVWKALYVTNITVNVKNTMELQCSSKNRGGLALATVRLVIEDADIASVKAAIRLTHVKYIDSLKDTSSDEYQSLATRVIRAVSSVYLNNPGYRRTSIVQFRRGSVICEFILQLSAQNKDHLTELLRQTVRKGSIAEFKVDKKYLLTEKITKVCPYDFFNVSWPVTLPSSTHVQRCPNDGLGTARRKCSDEGKWEIPDYNDCTSKNIMELQTQMASVLNKTIPSPDQVQEILTNLAKESSRPQVKGDIKISTLILSEVVEYNEKLSNDVEKSTSNIENFLLTASNLLNDQNNVQMKLLQQSDNTTTLLMSALDGFSLQAAGSLGTSQVRTKQFVARNLVMGIAVLSSVTDDDVTFPDYNDSRMTSLPEWQSVDRSYIVLPNSAFNASRVSRVSSLLYRTLSLFLNITSAYDAIGSEAFLGSRIIAASIKPTVSLVDPVVTIYNNVQKSRHPPSCVFWDFQLNSNGGGWSRDGCRMTSQDGGRVTCECDHMTNFAVLVSSYQLKEHDLPLRIITFIGCGLSLLGLVVTLLVHVVLWRRLKSNKTTIHVNLCVALLVANVVLLAGLDKTSDKIVCTAIAAILHYFFLSAVAWMLVEGIQIYVAIVMVFETDRKGKYFFLIGWGLPVLIVGIAMAVTQMNGYGTQTACWLSADQGLLYAFIGPVVVVVLVNIVIFVLVVRAMMTTQRMVTADEKQKARLAAKCCAVLLPLLGLTWSFGVLAIDQNVVIFLYLFAIFNSLQGFFIFVFHCLLDQQVRSAVSAWLIRRESSESGLKLKVISSSSDHSKHREHINRITTDSLTQFPDDIRTSSKVAPKYVSAKYKPSKT